MKEYELTKRALGLLLDIYNRKYCKVTNCDYCDVKNICKNENKEQTIQIIINKVKEGQCRYGRK